MMQGRFRGRHLVQGSVGVYHVTSRTACGQFLFDDEAKAVFLKILRKQAGFCGVDVLAYCVMGNHFHLLVSVPSDVNVSDSELLRRYRLLYSEGHCPPSAPLPGMLARLLEVNGEAGQAVRERLLARMHDLSAFVRELKQRFGIWYNYRHQNKGTIWSDRFHSVIVEASAEALSTVAAYIDLNPVRAGLVADPADYHFSSYGRAIGGNREARRGYERVFCLSAAWKAVLPSYNLILYGKGYQSKGAVGKDYGRIDPVVAQRVIENHGKLPLSDVLRLRVRYFTAGTAIGSASFLKELATGLRESHGLERKRDDYPMRCAEWGDLRSFRNLQVEPVVTSSFDGG
ncbi:transposase [Coraliomargarita sp. SDUM461004]|uniref:Transposase n=2 Tax=Thalassobacterium sedimentorum TaxID=3041258 RepID=A0ABU1AEE0_9BACT|nr:transposase [Coraliomargarita sp. SDUM461004]